MYDSYGEALLQSGRKDDAIKMYQKSVELNPDNVNGKKVLKELL
nr:tetratricopeptide repeat protein [uncultured Flavobacterium sp.]